MTRGTPTQSGPWCWIEKDQLRLIRDRFAPRSRVHAIATMTALVELASDHGGGSSFAEKTSVIAHRAGYSYRKCFGVLKTLEQIGVIKIQQQKIADSNLDTASTYTLLSLCTPCIPLCTPCIPLCTDREHIIPADRYEESIKKEDKKIEKRAAAPRARFASPSLGEVEAEASKEGIPQSEAGNFIDYYEARGWMLGKQPMQNWNALFKIWARKYREFNKTQPAKVYQPLKQNSWSAS